MFWTDRSQGKVFRSPLDVVRTGEPALVELLVSGMGDAIGIVLDRENDTMFFSELQGSLWSSPINGGAKKLIIKSGSITGTTLIKESL